MVTIIQVLEHYDPASVARLIGKLLFQEELDNAENYILKEVRERVVGAWDPAKDWPANAARLNALYIHALMEEINNAANYGVLSYLYPRIISVCESLVKTRFSADIMRCYSVKFNDILKRERVVDNPEYVRLLAANDYSVKTILQSISSLPAEKIRLLMQHIVDIRRQLAKSKLNISCSIYTIEALQQSQINAIDSATTFIEENFNKYDARTLNEAIAWFVELKNIFDSCIENFKQEVASLDAGFIKYVPSLKAELDFITDFQKIVATTHLHLLNIAKEIQPLISNFHPNIERINQTATRLGSLPEHKEAALYVGLSACIFSEASNPREIEHPHKFLYITSKDARKISHCFVLYNKYSELLASIGDCKILFKCIGIDLLWGMIVDKIQDTANSLENDISYELIPSDVARLSPRNINAIKKEPSRPLAALSLILSVSIKKILFIFQRDNDLTDYSLKRMGLDTTEKELLWDGLQTGIISFEHLLTSKDDRSMRIDDLIMKLMLKIITEYVKHLKPTEMVELKNRILCLQSSRQTDFSGKKHTFFKSTMDIIGLFYYKTYGAGAPRQAYSATLEEYESRLNTSGIYPGKHIELDPGTPPPFLVHNKGPSIKPL